MLIVGRKTAVPDLPNNPLLLHSITSFIKMEFL